MAKRGAPLGSRNRHEGAQWKQALKRALARSGGSVDKGLEKAARKLVSQAVSKGNLWAIEHLADRFDGKPRQTVEVQHTDRRMSYAERLAEEAATTSPAPAATESAAGNTVQ
jgi:hypothetical protein